MSRRTEDMRPAGRTFCSPADVRICQIARAGRSDIYALSCISLTIMAVVIQPCRSGALGRRIRAAEELRLARNSRVQITNSGLLRSEELMPARVSRGHSCEMVGAGGPVVVKGRRVVRHGRRRVDGYAASPGQCLGAGRVGPEKNGGKSWIYCDLRYGTTVRAI